MFKKFFISTISIVFLAIVAISAVGCGGKKDESAPSAIPPSMTNTVSDATVGLKEVLLREIKVTGTEPFTYQWCKIKRDGTTKVVSSTDTFKIELTDKANEGNYFVEVSNTAGKIHKDFKVTVNVPPPALPGESVYSARHSIAVIPEDGNPGVVTVRSFSLVPEEEGYYYLGYIKRNGVTEGIPEVYFEISSGEVGSFIARDFYHGPLQDIEGCTFILECESGVTFKYSRVETTINSGGFEPTFVVTPETIFVHGMGIDALTFLGNGKNYFAQYQFQALLGGFVTFPKFEEDTSMLVTIIQEWDPYVFRCYTTRVLIPSNEEE